MFDSTTQNTIDINTVTIGSDPEFGISFFGKPIAAAGLVPGNKKEPFPMNEGRGIQPDGVMVELTIPPCRTREEFVYHIMKGRKEMEGIVKEHNDDYSVVALSSAFYSEDQFVDKSTRVFGCDPSYCIYTKTVSPRPTPEEIGNLRTAGFHIHIGTQTPLQISDVEKLIFAMDLFIGLPSLLLDMDTERRKLYGNAGDFRYDENKFINKNLFVPEYRTLGGALLENEETIGFIYDNTIKAIEWYNNFDNSLAEELANDVKYAIDNDDKTLAQNLLNKLKIDVPTRLIKSLQKA